MAPAQKTAKRPLFLLILKPTQSAVTATCKAPSAEGRLPAPPLRLHPRGRSGCGSSPPARPILRLEKGSWTDPGRVQPSGPTGCARDPALEPAGLLHRPARTAHPSANNSGVNVRAALAGLRCPGRCGSLSQAAPSRWLRSNLFKRQPPVFTDSAPRYTQSRTHTHTPAAVPPRELRGVLISQCDRSSLAAEAWGWFASDLGGLGPRARAGSQRRGHSARSSCAPPVLRQGTPLPDRRAGGAPSRRPRSVEPGFGLASRGAWYTRRPSLCALSGEREQTTPAVASLLASISNPLSPACARRSCICSPSSPRSSHPVGNCGPAEAPRCWRSPPLRVDGKPVLDCGLRGDWRWTIEF